MDAQYYKRPGYNQFICSIARKHEHDILVDEEVREAVRRRGLQLRAYDDTIKH
jgi:hypothetical protein